IESAAVVELGDRELPGAHLILGFRAVRPGQRNGKPDLDVGLLCPQQIDAKRRDGKGCPGACRRQQTAAGNRSRFGRLPGHSSSPCNSVWFCWRIPVQIRPKDVRITCAVNGISVIIPPCGTNASLAALATWASPPAVRGSPAPLPRSSGSKVGDATCPSS